MRVGVRIPLLLPDTYLSLRLARASTLDIKERQNTIAKLKGTAKTLCAIGQQKVTSGAAWLLESSHILPKLYIHYLFLILTLLYCIQNSTILYSKRLCLLVYPSSHICSASQSESAPGHHGHEGSDHDQDNGIQIHIIAFDERHGVADVFTMGETGALGGICGFFNQVRSTRGGGLAMDLDKRLVPLHGLLVGAIDISDDFFHTGIDLFKGSQVVKVLGQAGA